MRTLSSGLITVKHDCHRKQGSEGGLAASLLRTVLFLSVDALTLATPHLHQTIKEHIRFEEVLSEKSETAQAHQ